jgi:hypothetical protein
MLSASASSILIYDEPRSCAFKQKVFEKVNPFCVLFTTEIKQPDDAIPRNFQKNPVTPLCRCRSFSAWEAVGDAGSLQGWQTHRESCEAAVALLCFCESVVHNVCVS